MFYYFDGGLIPLQSRTKHLLDTMYPEKIKLHKGKVTMTGIGVYYNVNFDLRNDPNSKVIGNIYECHHDVLPFFERFFGLISVKIDSIDCFMPTKRLYCGNKNKLYTNIKNIPNYKWNYEPENKIETSEC